MQVSVGTGRHGIGEMAEGQTSTTGDISEIYLAKPAAYFSNARADIVARLHTGSDSAILELGCGAGGTGRAAMGANKAGRYVGLELSETAAAAASAHLSEVVIGNVETMDLSRFHGVFDALIVSEVLEHLVDPWTVLERLAQCLKPGGKLYASSPNIAHWAVIWNLTLGRFSYQAEGIMDQTHLRWFTPRSYRALVEGAGFDEVTVDPVTPLRWKAALADRLTGGRLRHLYTTQIMAIGTRRHGG